MTDTHQMLANEKNAAAPPKTTSGANRAMSAG
jgi:hypothetical protein